MYNFRIVSRSKMNDEESLPPRITFGMIVLNGEPFTRYNLRALYPFAHEIVVVEGACPTAKDFATADGHSRDGTLSLLREFQSDEDPEGKLIIVTAEDEGLPNGFWSEKDEMSQAYARRATGEYLWQVDVDEFYRLADMQAVIEMLQQDAGIKAVSFRLKTFWGGPEYLTDGPYLRRFDCHRLFAWAPGYRYTTHRPPTVVDEQGRDLRTIKSVTADQLARRGIYLYHYSFLFPFQVHFKLAYYGPLSPSLQSRREAWFRNYFDLARPFFIDDTSILGEPSWLLRFQGQHPDAIRQLCDDINRGRVHVERRSTDDIETLLRSPWYATRRAFLPIVWKPIDWARTGTHTCRRIVLRLKWRGSFTSMARNTLRLFGSLVHSVSPLLRLACVSLPGISAWGRSRWTLKNIAVGNIALREAARCAQFKGWYPDDLRSKISWYGRHGWKILVPEPNLDMQPGIAGPLEGEGTLLVAARGFFERYTSDRGKRILSDAVESLAPGTCFLVYAPHEFAFGGTSQFAWIPRWEDLYELTEDIGGIRVLDFNPGFDRNGFFHFIIQRQPPPETIGDCVGKPADIRAAHYFYMNVGASRTHGHSTKVQSASGLRVLRQLAPKVSEHHFLARVPGDVAILANNIAMGHYGPWITTAKRNGALTILYGPGDRFRKERHEPFFSAMQSRGNFHEQYQSCHLAIMHAGGLWRLVDPWTYTGLCRWMDLPVSATVFPRIKKRIAPPWRRVFCFVGLYDEHQKGLATAREICKRCPDIRFIAVGCGAFGLPNCKEYSHLDNRSTKFRRIVAQADFIISPARDDCQPGPVAESGSLGLLPIVSEYSGYVLSFPRRMDIDDLDQCVATLRAAQAASEDEVQGWQMLNAQYLERFHRPGHCEALLLFYLNEAWSEFGH